MANKQLYQLFVQREELPGVVAEAPAATVINAVNGGIRVKDPVFTYDVDKYDREVLTGGSLSPQQPLIGKTEANISFGVELAGSVAVATHPPWAPLLEACGFRLADINSATFGGGVFTGSATGAAKHMYTGQMVQTAAAAKVAMIVHDLYEGQTKAHLLPVTGTPASADVFWPTTSTLAIGPVLTVGSGAATISGPAFIPTSVPWINLTTNASATDDILVDNIVQGATSKAVLQVLEDVTTAGAYNFRVLDGTPVLGETFNNITTGVSGSFVVHATDAEFNQPRFPTLTLGFIEDGRIKIAKGCRGTVNLSAEVGKPMFMNFQFKGAVYSVTNGGPISGIANVSKVPPAWRGVGFLLQSYVSGEPGYFNHATAFTPRIVSANFDIGGGANLQEDATQTTGTGGIAHTTNKRTSSGAMKIDVRPEASWPVITKLVGGLPFAIKHRISGGDNNTFLISAPGCLSSGASPTDTNNFGQDDVAFSMSALKPDGSDGDERELVISYHYAASSGQW